MGWRKTAFLTAVSVGMLGALSVLASSLVSAQSTNVIIGVGETTVLVQGNSSPGAQITVLDGGSVIGTTTANGAGSFSLLLNDQTPGVRTFSLYGQDVKGRIGDTVQVETNVQEHFQTQLSVFMPPIIRVLQSEAVVGGSSGSVAFEGSAAPNATLILYIDDEYKTVDIGSDGEWIYNLSAADLAGLAPGIHEVYAIVMASGGAQSRPSEVRSFFIQSPPASADPDQPAEDQPGSSGAAPTTPTVPVILSPKPGEVVTGSNVEVSGTAAPGTQIEVWNAGRLVGSVFVGADGRWKLVITVGDYANSLAARACNGIVCSDFTPSVSFFRESMTAAGPLLELSRYRLQAKTGDTVELQATIRGGESPYRLEVFWGDEAREVWDDATQEVTLSHIYGRAKDYSGRVVATDKQGRQAVAYFSVEVTAREALWRSKPFIITLSIGIPLIVLVLLIRTQWPRISKWF